MIVTLFISCCFLKMMTIVIFIKERIRKICNQNMLIGTFIMQWILDFFGTMLDLAIPGFFVLEAVDYLNARLGVSYSLSATLREEAWPCAIIISMQIFAAIFIARFIVMYITKNRIRGFFAGTLSFVLVLFYFFSLIEFYIAFVS